MSEISTDINNNYQIKNEGRAAKLKNGGKARVFFLGGLKIISFSANEGRSQALKTF